MKNLILILLFLNSCNTATKKTDIVSEKVEYEIDENDKLKLKKIISTYNNLKNKLNDKEQEILNDLNLLDEKELIFMIKDKNLNQTLNFLKKFNNINFDASVPYINKLYNKAILNKLNEKGFKFPYIILFVNNNETRIFIYNIFLRNYIEIFKKNESINDIDKAVINVFHSNEKEEKNIIAYIIWNNILEFDKRLVGDFNPRINRFLHTLKSDFEFIVLSYKGEKIESYSYNLADKNGLAIGVKIQDFGNINCLLPCKSFMNRKIKESILNNTLKSDFSKEHMIINKLIINTNKVKLKIESILEGMNLFYCNEMLNPYSSNVNRMGSLENARVKNYIFESNIILKSLESLFSNYLGSDPLAYYREKIKYGIKLDDNNSFIMEKWDSLLVDLIILQKLF